MTDREAREAVKAWESLKITSQMACDKEFISFSCRSCPYFYVTEPDIETGYTIARCLKENIRSWAQYRIKEGEK